MKDGWYWVKTQSRGWCHAELEDGWWTLTGSERMFDGSTFIEIGKPIETPDEYKE